MLTSDFRQREGRRRRTVDLVTNSPSPTAPAGASSLGPPLGPPPAGAPAAQAGVPGPAEVQAILRSRDRRFDGRFVVAVATTGIYCRPSCPSPLPKPQNLRLFASTAAARQAGYRACRRCAPDAAPGASPQGAGADVTGRALRLIADGAVDREGVDGLAARLGYSPRQLRRHLVAELGAGPQALAQAQRAQTARLLLESTDLPVTEVAFTAGFRSVRQFNETFRRVHGRTPSEVRERSRAQGPAAPGRADAGVLTVKLAYRPPLHAASLFGFLAARAVPGLEESGHDADGTAYHRRSLSLPHGAGVVTLRDADGHVACELRLSQLRDLPVAVARCRRLLDLDTDPGETDGVLGADPVLAPLVARRPGLRLPGHVDGHEAAIRAVLAQTAARAAARAVAARLVRSRGRPLPAPVGTVTHTFPTAAALAEDATLPHPARTLARRLADGTISLDPGADREETERALLAVPGIAPRTAALIRVRALGDPDVFWPLPGVGRATPRISARWRPWRSYGTHHLWTEATS
jgi:AraC family transcriptional regulator of adaptative response / DNA-3-methyladenine glycosylase II